MWQSDFSGQEESSVNASESFGEKKVREGKRKIEAGTFPIEFDSIKLLTLSGLALDMLVNTNIFYLIVKHYGCYKSFLYCSAFPLHWQAWNSAQLKLIHLNTFEINKTLPLYSSQCMYIYICFCEGKVVVICDMLPISYNFVQQDEAGRLWRVTKELNTEMITILRTLREVHPVSLDP